MSSDEIFDWDSILGFGGEEEDELSKEEYNRKLVRMDAFKDQMISELRAVGPEIIVDIMRKFKDTEGFSDDEKNLIVNLSRLALVEVFRALGPT